MANFSLFVNSTQVLAFSKMDENKHLNISVNNKLTSQVQLKRAGAQGIPITKGMGIPTSDNTWIWRLGTRLTHRNKRTKEVIYFERQADGHYHKVDDLSTTALTAMTAPTAGGTLAGTTLDSIVENVASSQSTMRTHSATSTVTATKKGRSKSMAMFQPGITTFFKRSKHENTASKTSTMAVTNDSAMTAPTAGGTLAGTTAPVAPSKVDILVSPPAPVANFKFKTTGENDLDSVVENVASSHQSAITTRTHSSTSTVTATKKEHLTIASAKKRKAATTSAKKGKVTAKAVLSEEDESGSYSPSDDSEEEETPAPVLARVDRSSRVSSRVTTKKATYVESDQDSGVESDGDFD